MNDALAKSRTKLELLRAMARRHLERSRLPAKLKAEAEAEVVAASRSKPSPTLLPVAA